jgi:spore coat-associated protein N
VNKEFKEHEMKAKSDRKRKLIVVGGILVATLVLASAFLVGSGAVFTSTSASPSNVFTAGVLTHSNTKDGSAILTASLMKPTDIKTGTVTIVNTGDLSGDFTLSMVKTADVAGTNAGAGHLYNVLKLKIQDGTTVVYDGNLKDFTNASLGTYAPAASHTYTFTVTFPDGGTPSSNITGDNIYQGSTTTVEFDWAAVQH